VLQFVFEIYISHETKIWKENIVLLNEQIRLLKNMYMYVCISLEITSKMNIDIYLNNL
jgi:hypothetical protein